MAVLTSAQLGNMRRRLREEWATPIDFTKTTINAVFQAVEDEYERNTNILGPGFELSAAAVIDTAASPETFTNPEKKMIGRAYLGEKHDLEAS